MVQVAMTGLFPAPIDSVWKVLHRHRDEEITAIHPTILSQRILEEEGEVAYSDLIFRETIVFERTWRLARRPWTAVWQYTQSPPETFRVELLHGEEPIAAGSYWENTYREVAEGTLISTEANIVFRDLKVPRFLQGWAIRRSMRQADKEDLSYLRRSSRSSIDPTSGPERDARQS